jgi:hypothetical protein
MKIAEGQLPVENLSLNLADRPTATYLLIAID